MKSIHTLSLITLLIALSTTAVQCMKQDNATLEIYNRNKIKQIKEECYKFEELCSIKPKPSSEKPMENEHYLFQNAYHKTENLRIYLKNGCGYGISAFYYRRYYGYSPNGAVIIGKIATLAEKKELINLFNNYTLSLHAIEKDKELAFLELYERKLQHWKTICLLTLAQQKDKTNSFTLLAVELIQYISDLITQTEESLLKIHLA